MAGKPPILDAWYEVNEKLLRARYAELKAARLADQAACAAHSAERIYAACCWQVRELEKELEQIDNESRIGPKK